MPNGEKINLQMISECIPNTSYDKKKFAAITIRLSNPKTTALLFSSGKLVVTGSVSMQMAVSSVKSITYLLKMVMPRTRIIYEKHVIQNIVSNVQIKGVTSIDLQKFYKDYSTNCTFQSSIFPGLIYRPSHLPIVILMFNSCRIVVTGARNYNDLVEGFKNIYETMQKYFICE